MTSMYYDDYLTDSRKYLWSGLCLLADAAVMVAEEEQRRRLLAEKGERCHKTVSEEEDNQMRFFYLFPRKIRSSLVKKRYTQQNPNVASTSSSSLLDLNLITTDSETQNLQNPSSDDEPLVCDEEKRAKKGKSKIVCYDEDYDDESENRLFEKNVKKFLRENFDNLNGASTSSSLLNLHCLESLTETKDLPNPNYQSSSPSSCLTENTSRKRRVVQQRKGKGGFKRAKVVLYPHVERETPEWVFQVMRYMNADAENPRLIFERTLFNSDVNSILSRLLIPFQKLIRNDFLTPSECRALERDEDNEDEENIGVGTILVNQRFKMWGLRLKIWVMEKKDSGHGTLNYTLNWGWNDVVKGNNLKAGDKISLWTFRCRGVLCFALDIE
ncbi:hypothetical protein ISN44_As12g036120 [Arabidopsis suecica]|uniref:TF-B3 domain-containing protein n=1 Tax=Arabidopsis suecica TaxID=45249 RepID=A0A8T1YR18_ARASU|nr:hypothetical protein ISN44_As12g036120 [Arabidopsis suecica]